MKNSVSSRQRPDLCDQGGLAAGNEVLTSMMALARFTPCEVFTLRIAPDLLDDAITRSAMRREINRRGCANTCSDQRL
jgi:hypothetical protein